jgi:hypothetical protein
VYLSRIVKRRARLPAAAVASTLALLLLGQCRRQDVAPPSTTSAVLDGARAVDPPLAAPPPSAAAPGADAATDEATPPASKGTWLEGNIYRFRLDDVRKCPPPAVAGGSRIGAVVRVTSKIDEVFVAPRDVKLESGGVILDSAIVTKAPDGCGPLLAPKSLRAGKTADGVVVFDVPPEFNPDHRPVKITFQPTRWGGAKRVEALLPDGLL